MKSLRVERSFSSLCRLCNSLLPAVEGQRPDLHGCKERAGTSLTRQGIDLLTANFGFVLFLCVCPALTAGVLLWTNHTQRLSSWCHRSQPFVSAAWGRGCWWRVQVWGRCGSTQAPAEGSCKGQGFLILGLLCSSRGTVQIKVYEFRFAQLGNT